MTEQHRNLMDMQLVQQASLQRPLRGVGTMHEHSPVPGCSLRLRPRVLDPIRYVSYQRIVRDGRVGRSVTEHEDPDTVMIAEDAPAIVVS